MTTHDLALAQIAEEIRPPGANYHFQDQILNGKMTFDYRLHPGVVEKSNALELMRLVGLEVTGVKGHPIISASSHVIVIILGTFMTLSPPSPVPVPKHFCCGTNSALVGPAEFIYFFELES